MKKLTIQELAQTQTEDPNILCEYLVEPEYSQHHPHVYTLVMEMPKSFHPNRLMALVEFEYVGESPEAYSKPKDVGAVNVLRITTEGYDLVTPHMLSQKAYEDIQKAGFDAISDADEAEIDRSRGEHKVW